MDRQSLKSLTKVLFGLEGRFKALPGEVDLNFHIDNGKKAYVLKLTKDRGPEEQQQLLFQNDLLLHLAKEQRNFSFPLPIPNLDGDYLSTREIDGHDYNIRLLSWMDGRVYSSQKPITKQIRQQLGACCGALTAALSNFDQGLERKNFHWDLAQGLWTCAHLELFNAEEKAILTYFQEAFKSGQAAYEELPKGLIHNDANDNNIILSSDKYAPKVIGLIDYGDVVYSQKINDLAVLCAYGIMGLPDPLSGACDLVSAYHANHPFSEKELDFLYVCIGMRLVISVTKSAVNKKAHPENEYLQISDQAAWSLLEKWIAIDARFAKANFRVACGYTALPHEKTFAQWAEKQDFSLKNIFPSVEAEHCIPLDLSVGSTWLGNLQDFADFEYFDFRMLRMRRENGHGIPAGGYLEARTVYSTDAYDKQGNTRKESRSIHLGVDFWLPAYTPVHALMEGTVEIATYDEGDKEYGGLIVLKHELEDFSFYSLYGHLTKTSPTRWKKGDEVAYGQRLGELGDYPENGNWPAHLHFQLMLDMLDFELDFPGVAYPDLIEVWQGICPDPNLLFKSEGLHKKVYPESKNLVEERRKRLGPSLSLSYAEPLQILRGQGAYLIDAMGRFYLDTVNNVPHVGHEHPAVVKAGQGQMAVLNTNTRYLHPNILALAEALQETLPPELCVFHFVNSGSEANELAMRMVKTASGRRGILASQHGYHGNTQACVDVSSYKFEGKGGYARPEHTHLFPIPDLFRGKHRGDGATAAYIEEIKAIISDLEEKENLPAGLILEPIISCGGQIDLPPGFLQQLYPLLKAKGIYCISDEVQVGCGRLGSHFWGFQRQEVLPDVVTIGKPLGNGHPVAAVVCTREVAEGFNQGMEYFNTFGGNPVSSAIATEVLSTVKREGLQANALEMGKLLKSGLKKLGAQHPLLADVRGEGLFLGIELLDEKGQPAARQAKHLVDRMKEQGVLMSLDGPEYNVLKIKPPLCFSRDQAQMLLTHLASTLEESAFQ